MSTKETAGAIDSYVDALLQCTGQLMLIVNNMAEYPGDDDGPGVDEVIRNLLLGVLEPELGRRPEIDVEAAGAILVETIDVIGRELYLVDPSALAPPGRGLTKQRKRRR